MHLQLHGGDGAGGASNVPHRPQSHTTNDPARSKVAAALKGRLIGSQGGIYRAFFQMFRFLCCAKTVFLVRFLRIHPVQSVINNPTQLSERGFPYIFYMIVFVATLRFFPQFSKMLDFDECCTNTIFLERFLRIRPVQSVVNSPTQLSGRGFPRIFYIKLFLSQLYIFQCSQMEAGP